MKGKSKYLLDILIPAYKRNEGLLRAVESVLSQVRDSEFVKQVLVTVRDDATPGFQSERLLEQFETLGTDIQISSNQENLGMSKNIFSMVENSQAEFCMVLTDDDRLQPNALNELICILRCLKPMEAFGGLYTPRYSYLESGKLNSVACRRFDGLMVIGANPGDAIRYCHDGFILTGLVFRQSYFSSKEWKANIENAYFPLINFGFMLETYRFLYLDRNWFYHTVLNFCHWEAWGVDSIEQNKRLYRDYIDAIAIISENQIKKSGQSFLKLKYLYYESLAYKRQLEVQVKMIAFVGLWKIAPDRARSRFAFWLAIISLFLITCRLLPYSRDIRGR